MPIKGTKHPIIDWKSVEHAYRANILGLREICERFGVSSPSSLCNKAKREGWTRDLGPVIARQVDRNLLDAALEARPDLKAIVDEAKANGGEHATGLLPGLSFIGATAAIHTEALQRHQRQLANAHDLCEGLLAELRTAGLSRGALTRLAHAARKADLIDSDEWRDVTKTLRDLGSSSKRSATLATLVSTLGNLQNLERQAIGLKPFELPKDDASGGSTAKRKGMRIEFEDAKPVVRPNDQSAPH